MRALVLADDYWHPAKLPMEGLHALAGNQYEFDWIIEAGYTFLLYHPGWMRTYMSGAKSQEGAMEPEVAALKALSFYIKPRADEGHLALIDYTGAEWPW